MSAVLSQPVEGKTRSRGHLILLWALLLGPSLTAGLGTTLGPHVLLPLLMAPFVPAHRSGGRGSLFVFVIVTLFLFGHAMLSELAGPCTDLLSKSLSSLLLFAVVIGALATLADDPRPRLSEAAMAVLAAVMVGSVAIDKVRLIAIGASSMVRPSGLFLEPSHFALAVVPLLVALLMSPNLRWRGFGLLITVLAVLLGASATLFLLLALGLLVGWLLMRQQAPSLLVVLRAMLVSGLVGAMAYLSPFWPDFVDRVQSLGTQSAEANVSSVVYVMGWELAAENLRNTGGWGLGFNRMGCQPRPFTDGVEVLDLLGLEDGNYNDGSFLIAKALSELGLWVLVLLPLLAGMGLRKARALSAGPEGSTARLMLALLICGMAGAFLRGTGYFSGPVLMMFFAFFWLRAAQRRTVDA